MPEKIWVKAAHARASFYQEVLQMAEDAEGKAKLVIEHIRAHTDPVTGEQVPVPMQVTDTPALQQAFLEKIPGTDQPARIVRCTAKEVAEAEGKAAKAPSAPAEKKAAAPRKPSGKGGARKTAAGVVAEPKE